MINLEKYAIGCMQENAIYSEAPQPLYVGNPLIEALPENRSREELLQLLLTEVPINREKETLMAGEDREDCLQAIYQCFVPWSVHLEIAKQMAKAIRSGYVKRNPCDPAYNAELRQLAACVQNKDPNFSRYTAANANAPGFSVIGYSGMGKTSAINHVLNLFPQVLFHANYQGKSFHSQLVWMKLECPFDGSVKGLCGQFFLEFDRLMNDNTYQRFVTTSRTTTDLLIPQMALLARRHSLGVLVIDEIQNISAAKSGGTEKMLNFLGHLMNTIGVPIVLVGTQETVNLLSSKLMLARRNTGQGAVLMDHLNERSKDWSLFVEGIWQYQWTKEYTELTEELSVDAGLDPNKLPENYVFYEGDMMGNMSSEMLMVGTKLGNDSLSYSGDPSPLTAYEQIVNKYRSSINYHTSLDHYGVKLGDGNMFEWAKDLSTNSATNENQDKDIVFVLNPEPLIAAGVNPEKVEGWIYAQVPVEENGQTTNVWKFLKPFDLK